MKKIIIIILSIIILVCIGFLVYKSNTNNQTDYFSNYTAEKTSASNEVNSNDSTENNTINNDVSNSTKNLTNNDNNKDKIISDFSTKLPKDTKARYSNIELACETLNDTVVKSGDTFSLWNTLGCPTKEKGYKKAKAFTSDGKVIKSYGGGICQVSTTIYNALLEVDGIKVTERHEHSRDVVYVKDGKDAAVSYKSADLKFKNNLYYDIRIKAKVKDNKVVIKIEKV